MWDGQLFGTWREEKYVQILLGKREGKKLFGRPWRKWEDNRGMKN